MYVMQIVRTPFTSKITASGDGQVDVCRVNSPLDDDDYDEKVGFLKQLTVSGVASVATVK